MILAEVATVTRGGSPRPIEAYMTSDADGLNWLKIGDVPAGGKYITSVKERVCREALPKTRLIGPGDLILSNSMSFGRPYLSTLITCIHDGWLALTQLVQDVSSEFMYYALSSECAQTQFAANAAGAVVQNLNAESVKGVLVTIPEPDEQARVAGTLATLDQLQDFSDQKLTILHSHKAALMQQLFPTLDGAHA